MTTLLIVWLAALLGFFLGVFWAGRPREEPNQHDGRCEQCHSQHAIIFLDGRELLCWDCYKGRARPSSNGQLA